MASGFRIELEQRRSIAEILTATVALYRRYPLLFAVLALAVMGPYELAVLAITGYGPLRRGHEAFAVHWLLILVETSLVTPLISALHMHAVADVGAGRRPRLGAVALRGLRVLPVVAAAEVMANIGIYLGLIALIIPGVLLAIRWAVVAQAASLEKGRWLDALRSSGRLTESHYRHVVVLLVLPAALGLGVYLAVSALPLGETSGVASVSVGIAEKSLFASFSALTLAVLYFDLRARTTEPRGEAPREHQHLRDLD
jgi:hypothetical protein